MYSSTQRSQVLRSLESILQSEGFASAPQLRNFLNFIVKKTLENQVEDIKGYTIGVDALGRDENFDPHTDPVVRVMAGRLRQALKNYYSENTDDTSVVFEMEKGTYVPRFAFGISTPDISTDELNSDEIAELPSTQISKPRFNPMLSGLLAMLAIVMSGIAIWFALMPDNPDQPIARVIATPNLHATRVSISLHSNDDPTPKWFSLQEAEVGLIAAFSRFKEFQIFPVPMDNNVIGPNKQLADYHFSVLIAQAGNSQNVRALAKLIRQSDGSIIWSKLIPIDKPEQNDGINSEEFSGDVLSSLLSPYGVIYSDIQKHKETPPHLDCVNRFYLYFAAETPEKYDSARSCIEDDIAAGRASSSDYSRLTFLQLEVYRKNLTGYESDPLNAAEKSAREAIVLGPLNARAHQALFGIHKIRGHKENAIASANRAVELNPFDSDIMGDYAAYLVSIGEFERAAPILKKAVYLTPSLPSWLEFFAFLQAEFTDDFEVADNFADHTIATRSPLSAITVVLAAHRQGKSDIASSAYATLLAQEPDFGKDAKAPLLRRGFSPDIAERISKILDLVKATNSM